MIAADTKLVVSTGIRSASPIPSHNGSSRVVFPARTTRRRFGVSVSTTNRAAAPENCTADELHYVGVSGTEWKLALWRYLPSPEGERRNRPLLLLSGLGVNALSFDLAPQSSFARHMSSKGFDTWILEIRGTGLSSVPADSRSLGYRMCPADSGTAIPNGKGVETVSRSGKWSSKFVETFASLSERLSDHFEEGNNSFVASQIKGFSLEILTAMEEGRESLPSHFLQDPFFASLDDFLKELDLLAMIDWDFDHCLQEDLPAAMEYIRSQSRPKNGKLFAIGHSMGGILLYAMLSQSCFEGRDSGLTSVTTLGSTLDYSSSKSLMKLFLPVADPAKALNIPAIPLGALAAALYPLISRPPYFLSWLSHYVSSPGMLDPNLFEKLALNSVGTVPSKLLLQLSTAFLDGGLQDRSGSFYYKEHLRKCNVPVLALAGDHDPICPPEAVYETAKVIPRHLVTYRVLGQQNGPHFAHYDIVGSRLASHQVYPIIIDFLRRHDT